MKKICLCKEMSLWVLQIVQITRRTQITLVKKYY